MNRVRTVLRVSFSVFQKNCPSRGRPNAWETAHRLDLYNSADGAQDSDRDGYTNVEEFLNQTDPREYVDYRNLRNNPEISRP